MVYLYRCKKCQTKFLVPMKIPIENNRTTYVCPNCKSRNWGPLDW
jgi:DNA-directed RNA polymerase subunit RPC12/RpoP